MYFVDDYCLMAALENGMLVSNGCISKMDYSETYRDGMIGFRVLENHPLTAIYGFPVRVIKFLIQQNRANDLDQAECNASWDRLLGTLADVMMETPAYYVIRFPAFAGEGVSRVQQFCRNVLFCGGTVAYAINPAEGRANMAMWKLPKEDVCVFLADSAYLEANCRKLCKIAEDSFANYSGQYHIAPRTAPKAGQIYTNWIRTVFEHPEAYCMMCVECCGEPAGFSLLSEDEYGIDMELTAVSEQFRGRGLYTELMRENVRYAVSRDRIFVSSTQLDNFGSQRTWAKVGMRPCYTIYNFHCDCF